MEFSAKLSKFTRIYLILQMIDLIYNIDKKFLLNDIIKGHI